MSYSIAQVLEQLADLIVSKRHIEAHFSRIASTQNFDEFSLIFVSEAEQLPDLGQVAPAAVITTSTIAKTIDHQPTCAIAVTNVRLAQARIKQLYADYVAADLEWPEIHPSSVIHPSVKLGVGIRVGPNSVVGEHAVIGDHTLIRANCVIERGASIGQFCAIHNLVNIGYDCKLGDRVVVRPGVIIGNEGFGFAQDDNHHHHRIPQTGIVEIHDDVQIGANSNIDRGTYGATVISRGVKIDALCHIAHNVFIDEDALFVAQSGVAGSSNIGKRVVASGQTGILDHRTVVDDAVLVHRCGVTEDILQPGLWAGTPPKPFKEYVGNLNPYKKFKRLEQRLDEKLAHLQRQRSREVS